MPTKSEKRDVAVARPSSSIVLISPENEVLLLHRVRTSTSFASAHVFPGGNISPHQDGEFDCAAEDPRRHFDALNYRRAAIRELFEESGILLAKDSGATDGRLIHVDDAVREKGRHDIHNNKIGFGEWLRGQNSAAEMDTDNLIPFTHWITPPNLPKRFSTQMYLYFLPIPGSSANESITAQGLPEGGRQEVQIPTSDGGIEINEARFLPASKWIQQAQAGKIILYPPQFLLLSIVSQFLDRSTSAASSLAEKEGRRKGLLDFIHSENPPWTDKFVCPRSLQLLDDQRVVLALDHPGPELHDSGKKGDFERVILVKFGKDGPRNVEVRWKKDVLEATKSVL
ncbi:NUDIX family hydrolase, putative [Talaromyces stipitatus ATCC 10500]|uniref:NUDIX family hydrolase, putative n=1 Tax=Talaromyces stipitatus (strain ATCC 10500 / CBS 375.48 / QM 6759 / NRRL 1006) TaxID=441959 RepID=B8M8D4_TALSN|nr:NUDIX family hydrolase, putative [Talaromyces stipitatus ATCC 10500]EED20447.1 NUDIX family hydrolase, putative [Talaromyces stipitatus ATCC 10500]